MRAAQNSTVSVYDRLYSVVVTRARLHAQSGPERRTAVEERSRVSGQAASLPRASTTPHTAPNRSAVSDNPAAARQSPASKSAGSGWWTATLSRRRVQMLGAILFAVVLPGLFRWSTFGFDLSIGGFSLQDPIVVNGILGNLAAITLGFITFRQIKLHPIVNSSGYIICAFVVSYGILAILLFLIRAEYSRFELGASLGLSVIWFLAVNDITRHALLRIAVIPSPGLGELPETPGFHWFSPDDPYIDRSAINGVVADSRANHDPEWQRFLALCALSAVPIFDARQITEQITGRIEINQFSGNSLPSTLHGLTYAKLKQAIDLVFAIIVSPIFLVIILAAGIAIHISSGGPAIFKQYRMGFRGKPFIIYKLRTMKADAEIGGDFTTTGDARVTSIGRFLRKYRIDEFPQILNILRGEMSWIGPRPESVILSRWYEREVPFYCYRHIVRPGLSGWAQVHQGNVAQVDAANRKLQYDFYYIKYLSPWLDLLVIAKTIQTVCTGFGSV